MWIYSSMLTLVVMASLPLYAILSVAITPTIRARLNEKFNRGRGEPIVSGRGRERHSNREGSGRRATAPTPLG